MSDRSLLLALIVATDRSPVATENYGPLVQMCIVVVI
jgi:hypothetical protein